MKKIYRHGDLLIKEVGKLPDGLKKLGHKTLAEGEVTGHHHTFKNGSVQLFAKELEPTHLEVGKDSVLEHQEHGPITIGKGVYQVIREREYNPFEEEIQRVLD